MDIKKETARGLLEIGAVFFRPDVPFIWASGVKSPVYCDNRLTLSFVKVRNVIENGLAKLVETHFPEAEILMGTSTAGIAHAAIAAHIMGLPMGYVRAGVKGHGRQNQIEGQIRGGDKTVVVEDLISTGGSAIEVVDILRDAGAEVLGVASIFTYGMKKGEERLKDARVKGVSLTDLDTVMEIALEQGLITSSDTAKLLAFRDNPADEGWIKK